MLMFDLPVTRGDQNKNTAQYDQWTVDQDIRIFLKCSDEHWKNAASNKDEEKHKTLFLKVPHLTEMFLCRRLCLSFSVMRYFDWKVDKSYFLLTFSCHMLNTKPR